MERPPKSPSKEPVVTPSTFVAPSREDLMQDVQGFIKHAFEARTEYIRQEVNTVTLASVRRILEKDLNVESGFLKDYKDFLRGLIMELLHAPEGHSPGTEKVIDELGKCKEKVIEEIEGESEEIKEVKEDSKPKMKRLLKKADSEGVKDEVVTPDQVLNGEEEPERDIQGRIWDAAHKRASQFKAEAETLTVKKVRRLLEQDLELQNGTLDAYKDQIRAALDEILNSENAENVEDVETPENEESTHVSYCEAPAAKTKKRRAAAPESTKKPSKKRKAASADEIDGSDNVEHEETPKVRKGKKSKEEVVPQDDEVAGEDKDGDEEPREKDRSSADEADDEMPERRKPKSVEPKPAYSRKVEHLKSILKDCGITVPPSVYKKAKQAGESRREETLIAELEAILRKEGLTASASRDEIKAVRKRKEKLKDLEGIDTSNIIEEPRGRRSRTSANSFFAPRRNEPIDLGDEDEDDDEDEDEDEDGDDNSEGDPNVELQDDDDDED